MIIKKRRKKLRFCKILRIRNLRRNHTSKVKLLPLGLPLCFPRFPLRAAPPVFELPSNDDQRNQRKKCDEKTPQNSRTKRPAEKPRKDQHDARVLVHHYAVNEKTHGSATESKHLTKRLIGFRLDRGSFAAQPDSGVLDDLKHRFHLVHRILLITRAEVKHLAFS